MFTQEKPVEKWIRTPNLYIIRSASFSRFWLEDTDCPKLLGLTFNGDILVLGVFTDMKVAEEYLDHLFQIL